MWTMGIQIVLILMIAYAVICKQTFIPLDCAKHVHTCPIDQITWTRMNEISGCPTSFGYVCMRDSQGFLVETCMANFTVEANTGNCPVLYDCVNGKPYLGTKLQVYPCPEELRGCPPKDHDRYSIYKLYTYPRCIGNMSEKLPKSVPTTTTEGPSQEKKQGSSHILITTLIILLVAAIIILFCVFVLKKKREPQGRGVGYEQYLDGNPHQPLVSEEKSLGDLRRSIIRWNKMETDQIQIFPLDSDVSMKFDDLYTEVLVNDESDKTTYELFDKTKRENVKLHNIFLIQETTPARFIFMLGEAGYGKSVQCQKITKSWCQAWEDDNFQDDLVKRLREFDFLFFVKLRDARNHETSLIEIILDAYSRYHQSQECLNSIRMILEQGRCKMLVILDGLDEWNISDGIPNYNHRDNCTILMTMRSWKFMEVKNIRIQAMDRVVRLHGFDSTGFKYFTDTLLCKYLKMDKASSSFHAKTSKIKDLMCTPSYAVASVMNIPLLALFCILSLHEDVESGKSITTLYLSILETLMKRSSMYCTPGTSNTDSESVADILKDYCLVKHHINELLNLGKIAFSGLTSEKKTLIFGCEELNEIFGQEALKKFLTSGLLIKVSSPRQLHKGNIGISFLHKTIQEFLAALYLFAEGNINENFLRKHVIDIEKALGFSMVLTFTSGLSPANGCQISKRLTLLASEDKDIENFRFLFSSESYETVFHLYDLQLRCYREVRRQQSIKCFHEAGHLHFSLSDIILHGKDTDYLVTRETADILLYHTGDIESLQMKFIPDDEQKGITNDELYKFLDKSTSIKSVNIDGYVDGKCRVFRHFSKKMSHLSTLGLHNIAVEGEILTNLFTQNTTKNFKALGLFYIRSSDNPKVRFEYKFTSEERIPSLRSGFEQKRRIRALHSPSDSDKDEGSGKPLLKDVLIALQNFNFLTTLHVSYMESLEDRNTLLTEAKKLQRKKQLKDFGYRGSAIYLDPDDEYDTEVIKIILTMNQLEYILLCDIDLNDTFPAFPEILQLKKITFRDVSLNKMEWSQLVTTLSELSKNACLTDVVLTDTDIDDESMKLFEDAPRLSIKMLPT